MAGTSQSPLNRAMLDPQLMEDLMKQRLLGDPSARLPMFSELIKIPSQLMEEPSTNIIQPRIEITTDCETNKDPSCLVSTVHSKNPDGAVEFKLDFESIDAENCLQFRNKGGGSINLESAHYNISSLHVVAENKIFEVFANNQFLTSSQGTLFDDFEETKIYTFEIKVQPPSSSLKLRIPGQWETLWMFCIKALLTDRECSSQTGNFNLSNVNAILGSGTSLSKNAQNFKTLFENFQKTPGGTPSSGIPPGLPGLLSHPGLIQRLPASPPGGSGDQRKDSGNQKGYITTGDYGKENGDPKGDIDHRLEGSGKEMENLKECIDQRLGSGDQGRVKRDLMEYIDQRLGSGDQGREKEDLKEYIDQRLGSGHQGRVKRDLMEYIGQRLGSGDQERVKRDLKEYIDQRLCSEVEGKGTEDLKEYIDQRLIEMETRLLKRIEESEQRTNQKLDLILQKLSEH